MQDREMILADMNRIKAAIEKMTSRVVFDSDKQDYEERPDEIQQWCTHQQEIQRDWVEDCHYRLFDTKSEEEGARDRWKHEMMDDTEVPDLRTDEQMKRDSEQMYKRYDKAKQQFQQTQSTILKMGSLIFDTLCGENGRLFRSTCRLVERNPDLQLPVGSYEAPYHRPGINDWIGFAQKMRNQYRDDYKCEPYHIPFGESGVSLDWSRFVDGVQEAKLKYDDGVQAAKSKHDDAYFRRMRQQSRREYSHLDPTDNTPSCLWVHCQVKDSKGKGKGLFTIQFIPKGALVWQPNPLAMRRFQKQHFMMRVEEREKRGDLKDFLSHVYGWIDPEGRTEMIELSDDSRFTNHSSTPNLAQIGQESIAARDIQAGEELTEDYALYTSPEYYIDLCTVHGVLPTCQVAKLFH